MNRVRVVLLMLVVLPGIFALAAAGQSAAPPGVAPSIPANPYVQEVPAGANVYYEPVTSYRMVYYNKQADPELAKLHASENAAEKEVAEAMAEYAHRGNDADAGKIKAKLAAALEKQFDLQHKRREHEATKIEEQLKKLRELIKKRSDARQTIIEKRLDQLTREADGLGWSSPAVAAPPRNSAPGYAAPLGQLR